MIKKRNWLLIGGLVLSLRAVAGIPNYERQGINNLLNRISDAIEFSDAGPREVSKAKDLLREALYVLDGRRQNPSENQFTCVSRDNDGRSPYSIGLKNIETLELINVKNVVYSENQDCLDAVTKSKNLGTSQIICGSRDADGRSPYAIFQITGTQAKNTKITYDSLAGCNNAIAISKITRSVVGFCGSSDGDGRSPYAVFVIDRESGSLKKQNTTFNSLEECQSQLN